MKIKYNASTYKKLLVVLAFVIFFASSAVVLGAVSGPNLIANPMLQLATVSSTTPDHWLTGGYGTNDRSFTYPVPGMDNSTSTQAARVSISTSTGAGDAKWYFEPIPVTTGRQYNFSDSYISNVPTELAACYSVSTSSDCLPHTNGDFAVLPTANTWVSGAATFTVPVGSTTPEGSTVYMTVYHLISGVGTLTTTNYSLTEIPLPAPFANGFVSFTFDDGLTSQYQNAKPILDSHGMKATFYIITHTVAGLSINNGSLDVADPSSSTTPIGWLKTVSPNGTFKYPVSGHSGNAAEVSSTQTASNAAWYFTPIAPLSDQLYSFSDFYKSDTNTEVVLQLTSTTGVVTNADVVDQNVNSLGSSLALNSSGNVWTNAQAYFYVPPDTASMTIMHRLLGVGTLDIDDMTLGVPGYMSSQNVLDLQTDGQDIGGHTQSHADLTAITPTAASAEIAGGRQDLLNGGILSPFAFDYPYGHYSQTVEQLVQSAGFTSGRTVAPPGGFNGKDTDPFALLTQSVNASTTAGEVQSWIDQAKNSKEWLILALHDVVTSSSTPESPYGTTAGILQTVADYLSSSGVPVETVCQGTALITGTNNCGTLIPTPTTTPTTTPDTIAPVITLSGANPLNLTVGDTYADPGATVTDNVNATTTLTVGGDVVNTAVAGTYHVTYNAVDAAGNHATEVVRTVNVSAVAQQQFYGGGGGGGSYVSPTPVSTTVVPTPAAVAPDAGCAPGNIFSTTSGKRCPLGITLAPSGASISGQVLGAANYKFTQFLRRGMKGDAVMQLQERLRSEGQFTYAQSTGNFGSMTFVAVKSYQAAHSLPSTGYVGPLTVAELNK